MSLYDYGDEVRPHVRSPGDCIHCNRSEYQRRKPADYRLPSGRVVKLCGACLHEDPMLEHRIAEAERRSARRGAP